MTAQQIRRIFDEGQTQLGQLACLWRDALEAGSILTFRAIDGAHIVASPEIKGTGVHGYRVDRFGGNVSLRGKIEGSAWTIALRIVEHVGHIRPHRVVGTALPEKAPPAKLPEGTRP